MTDAIDTRILYAIFCMSRDTLAIDAGSLGRAVGVTATEAADALVRLERAGLVDASRARLTMVGLAKAAAVDSGTGGPRIDLSQARPAIPAAAAPLAAGPSDRDTPSAPIRLDS